MYVVCTVTTVLITNDATTITTINANTSFSSLVSCIKSSPGGGSGAACRQNVIVAAAGARAARAAHG